jgi:CRP/FNR family transcriptional regulator, cyclic AMP receptor protein
MSINCSCKDIAGKYKNYSTKCFCKFWLFENFSEEEYNILKTIGKQKIISKGQTVFFQGAPADEIFLIKTGRIKLLKYFKDGSEIILDFRKNGEILGENAFINEGFFPMHAIAMEETITCGAKKTDLEKIILKYPDIGLTIMKNMSEKISTLTNRLGDMTIGNLEDRLYQILINIAKRHGLKNSKGYQIAFTLTHEELGFLANAHRVSVTKAVNKLIKSGKVIRKGKIYSFPDNSMDDE